MRSVDIKALWALNEEAELARIRRDHLGYVLQSGGLLPFLNVKQNIQLPLRISEREQKDASFDELAVRMGIAGLLEKKPQHLSGGQRQRVAILRAMVHRPLLILADEPTAAVDGSRARGIVRDFHTLAKEYGSAVVMVTHNVDLIEPVADALYTYRVSQHPRHTPIRCVSPYSAGMMSNRPGVVARLALCDMRHEWILTVCMVLAMGAVIAPLMLLMGLKHGTVATLRHKLVQDPVYREIRPTKTREYPSQWFQEFAARPEVGFLDPQHPGRLLDHQRDQSVHGEDNDLRFDPHRPRGSSDPGKRRPYTGGRSVCGHGRGGG